MQKAIHFQKARQFGLLFYSQKRQTLYVMWFTWNFWNWHLYIYKKRKNLCYVTFLFTKKQKLRKKQDNLRHIFIYTKSGHFSWRNFHVLFEISGGKGGIFSRKKECTLCWFFIYKKQWTFRYVLYSKRWTICLTFLYEKMHYTSRFYIWNLLHGIFWYLTINVRMIRAIRSINKFYFFTENWSYSYNK